MLNVGDELHGRYIVEALIGEGGMGAVYRAHDTLKGLGVAIKEFRMDNLPSASVQPLEEDTLVHPGLTLTREQALEQFKLEAQMLSRLSHPNLPEVDDFFILNERGYIAMTLIEGFNLLQVLNQQGHPFAEERVRPWLMQISNALSYCHTNGVIHRDLKPENLVLVQHDHLYLIDFGIAKASNLGGGGTLLGARGVSAGYAPPEQYGGKGATDARSDIYALGATLYCLLTGRVPPESVERLSGSPLLAPRQFVPSLSAEMESLVIACLELDRNRRPQSAAEILRTMVSWDSHTESADAPLPMPPRPAISTSELAGAQRQPATVPPAGRPSTVLPLLPIGTAPFNPQRTVQLRVIKARGGPINDLAFAPSGRTLASAAHLESSVKLWSVDSGECIETLGGFNGPVTTLAFAPNSRRLTAGSEDHFLRTWDLDNRGEVKQRPLWGSTPRDVAFSADGNLMALVKDSGSVDVQNFDKNLISVLEKLPDAAAASFSADGNLLAVALRWHEIHLFSSNSWKFERRINPGTNIFLQTLAFSPDGRFLACGTNQGIILWHASTFHKLRTLEGHRGDVYALAFSPDGSVLASGSADHTIRLWNPANGRALDVLVGHDLEVTCLSFSADGWLLASGSKDGTLRLWGVKG